MALAGRLCHSLNNVVESAVLSDRDERRLVVRSSVDRGETVSTSRETTADNDAEHTALGDVVQALEEHELSGVRGRRRVERRDGVDDDVGVALDIALRVHDLGRGEVVLVRVREVARLEVADRHLDREVRVGLDRREVRRELELGRRHVRRRRDDAHRRGVARARLDLLAVRDRKVRHGRAEVDEVVRRRERGDLASGGLVLAVVLEAGRDDGLDERQRCLRITARVATSSVVASGSSVTRAGVVAALASVAGSATSTGVTGGVARASVVTALVRASRSTLSSASGEDRGTGRGRRSHGLGNDDSLSRRLPIREQGVVSVRSRDEKDCRA